MFPMQKRKTPRAIVVLSDIHAGSTVALMPPEFTTLEGVVLTQNPIQKWLWECWQDAQGWIDQTMDGDPFALVLNGDLTEGVHHGTKQVISPDTGDHVECALHLLRPLVRKATKTYVIKGTECHTGNNEIVIGKALKTAVNPETGLPAWDRLTIDAAGVRCVFRHHIGTSVRRGLAATQFSMQLVEEQVEAANNGEPIPRVLCCAHRHKFGAWQDEHGIALVSPPWQGLSRFAHKVVSQARTKPGVFILDWRGVSNGQLPKIHRRIYDTPHPKAETL
jgi:hypothetical protein